MIYQSRTSHAQVPLSGSPLLLKQVMSTSAITALADQKVSRGCRAIQPLGVGEDHVAIGCEKEGSARRGKPVDLDKEVAGRIQVQVHVQVDGSGTMATKMSCIRQPAEQLLRCFECGRDDMKGCDASRRPAGEMVG